MFVVFYSLPYHRDIMVTFQGFFGRRLWLADPLIGRLRRMATRQRTWSVQHALQGLSCFSGCQMERMLVRSSWDLWQGHFKVWCKNQRYNYTQEHHGSVLNLDLCTVQLYVLMQWSLICLENWILSGFVLHQNVTRVPPLLRLMKSSRKLFDHHKWNAVLMTQGF